MFESIENPYLTHTIALSIVPKGPGTLPSAPRILNMMLQKMREEVIVKFPCCVFVVFHLYDSLSFFFHLDSFPENVCLLISFQKVREGRGKTETTPVTELPFSVKHFC